MRIIGITGTIGAGKNTVVDYLVEKKGFAPYATRAFITAEVEKRGLPVNRDSLTLVANELRAAHSPRYIIEALCSQALEKGVDAVIESVRTPAEAEYLREQGAVILAVDADRKLRYERIQGRKSHTDQVDYETFVAQENREMTSTDPNKQNILSVIESADHYFLNNGKVEELYAEIDTIVDALGN